MEYAVNGVHEGVLVRGVVVKLMEHLFYASPIRVARTTAEQHLGDTVRPLPGNGSPDFRHLCNRIMLNVTRPSRL
jgi:hypothetical protein